VRGASARRHDPARCATPTAMLQRPEPDSGIVGEKLHDAPMQGARAQSRLQSASIDLVCPPIAFALTAPGASDPTVNLHRLDVYVEATAHLRGRQRPPIVEPPGIATANQRPTLPGVSGRAAGCCRGCRRGPPARGARR
jgi:hypothetical protein